jgi:hypothetical protein
MSISPLSFPNSLPAGYQEFDNEPSYDAEKHLALEFPQQTWMLEDFGYNQETIARCASSVAVTAPFRLLSDEGLKALYQVAISLKEVSTEISGNRNPSHLAGGVYRSKFLRDLCACPVILQHMSEIAGTSLAAHSLPSQQVYINYNPKDINKAVDAWHYDGVGFDYVIMLSDPSTLRGGFFEYFKGTKFEIASTFDMKVHEVRYGIKKELELDRVIQVKFPEAGFAVFQQGNMVVHRAARLEAPAERITVVPGMVALQTNVPDPTSLHDIINYREPGVIAETARHSAWLARAKLAQLIDELPLTNDVASVKKAMIEAIADVSQTLDHLSNNS